MLSILPRLLTALCFLATAASQASGGILWNKYRGNAADSGFTRASNAIGVYSPGVGWRSGTNGAIQSSPAFGPDGTLYFGSDDRSVYAVNGSNGYVKWKTATAGFVESSPAISSDGKTLYVGCSSEDETLRTRTMVTVCCTAIEGGLCNLQCPATMIINQINVASFGTPTGTCTVSQGGAYTSTLAVNNACDAAETEEFVADACLDQDSCSVPGNAALFDDPCPGTTKQLAISASCIQDTTNALPRGWIMTGSSPSTKTPKINTRIGRIRTLPANYVVTLQIYPVRDTRTTMRNILHLTSTKSDSQRLPAVFFCDGATTRASGWRGRRLCIFYSTGLPGDLPVSVVTSTITLNQWTTVEITIDLTELQTMRVKLSGGTKWSKNVPLLYSPTVFSFNNVDVFLSDGFYNAANCMVRSVQVRNNFDSFVYAMGTAMGNTLWQYRTQGYVSSSPSISADGNTIYVGTMNNTLVALTPQGSARWTASFFRDSVQSSPALDSAGNIYVGCDDGKIYAIAPTGSLLWSQATGAYIFGAPAMSKSGNAVIVASADQFIYSYRTSVVTFGNARTPGSLVWRLQTVGSFVGSPAVSLIDGTIVAAAVEGVVYAITSNGLQKWTFDINANNLDANAQAAIIASPVIDGSGNIFVGSDNGNLYALSPTGSLMWSVPTGGAIFSDSIIGPDSNLYVGSGDTYMYQIARSQRQGSFAVFNYTGATQTFTVPPLTSFMTITAYGAEAASPTSGGADGAVKPGLGGSVTATFPVTPGQVLYINVGQQAPASSSAGGWNGGGSGNCAGNGGGGASDVSLFNKTSPTGFTRIIVAGGGGGCGYYQCLGNGFGGAGGGVPPSGASAGSGSVNTYIQAVSNCQGLPGTQASGGAGGSAASGKGLQGTFGAGGSASAALSDTTFCSAGGGGGWFGGGASAGGCGAGGGSSYISPTAVSSAPATSAAGVRIGNGQVLITLAGSPSAAPTRFPTPRPSSLPSPLPVAEPTIQPTASPSPNPTTLPTAAPSVGGLCQSWVATPGPDGQYDSNPNAPVCVVRACEGRSVLLSTCPTSPGAICQGLNGGPADSFLRLFDASGQEVANNDDGPAGCGKCSQINYLPPPGSGCQNYVVREGCGNTVGSQGCSGTTYVGDADLQASLTILPTPQPSFSPSYAAGLPVPEPTVEPTAAPSPVPTNSPTTGTPFKCVLYESEATNFDRTGRAACGISAGPGATFTVSMCSFYFPNSGATCTGNTMLRLLDPSGEELPAVETQDWRCGTCSQLTYSVPAGTPLQTYTVAEGCNGFGECSGTAVIVGSGFQGVTFSPTASPTIMPTYRRGRPTPGPTSIPTTAATTAAPTASQLCPSFTASQDASDLRWNEPVCGIVACSKQSFTASMCNGIPGTQCNGQETLRIIDVLTRQVLAADDTVSSERPICSSGNQNNRCAAVSYSVPSTVLGCRRYLIQEGCLANSQCSGRVAVTGTVRIFLPTPTANPTLSPTYFFRRPTPLPTRSPIFSPSLQPTISPTRTQTCVLYQSPKNSFNDMVDVPMCGVTACAGQPFTVSLCGTQYPGATCTGNTFLRLFDSTNSLQLAQNDNGVAAGCGQCAQLSYSPPANSGCQLYLIREGCSGAGACSGTAIVSGASMNVVSYTPTEMPTSAPTYVAFSPTPVPTVAPTALRRCNMFTDLGFAATCGVNTCQQQTVTVSMCSSNFAGAYCTGDTFLSLVDAFGNTVASNDNGGGGCGRCSQLTYTTPPGSPCQVYTIRETCLSGSGGAPGSCTGSVIVSGTSFRVVPFAPTFFPTMPPTYGLNEPTFMPTTLPSALPTVQATSAIPSQLPTCLPTTMPTIQPTRLPTIRPSPRPSRQPTFMPSSTLVCPAYTASKTNGATTNVAVCGVSMCSNTTFLATTCNTRLSGAECNGNTLLRIFTQDGEEVPSYDILAPQPNSVNACPCGSTVQYTSKPSDGCQVYTIREGCVAGGDCSGTVAIAAPLRLGVSVVPFDPTSVPTLAPTYLAQHPTPPPTAIPTLAPSAEPSLAPSAAPTATQFQCQLYSVATTFNDGFNTPVCGVTASPGQTFTVSMCAGNFPGARCTGNTFLRLFGDLNGDGLADDLLAVSDTGVGQCGTCAQLSYTPPPGLKSQTFVIREGCDLAGRCTGVAVIAGNSGIQLVTYSPTARPTTAPTYALNDPTPLPTFQPSLPPSAEPTAGPSTNFQWISSVPTNSPTPSPTLVSVRCPLFGTSWAAGTLQANNPCTFQLCGGQSVNITTCHDDDYPGAYCTGNPALKLGGSANGIKKIFTSNDNGKPAALCGLCPAISFTAPGAATACQLYNVQETCASTGGPCSGMAAISSNLPLSLTNPGNIGLPTQSPTFIPGKSAVPSTAVVYTPGAPTPGPTPAPSMGQFCPPFSVSNTNSAQDPVNTAQCTITACGGQTITVGGCPIDSLTGLNSGMSCLGDTWLKLISPSGDQVAENDDSCGACASITYKVPFNAPTQPQCNNFVLRQGCFENQACSGTSSVDGGMVIATLFPTAQPTVAPTTPPTPLPTTGFMLPSPAPSIHYGVPSLTPTAPPNLVQSCKPFTVSMTNGATQDYSTCGIYACAGSTFTVSTCKRNYGGTGASCTGDTILSLFDADDTQQAMNDDGPGACAMCSQFTFTATAACQTYTLHQGCKGDDMCTGTAVVVDQYNDVRVQTYNPTMVGTRKPSRFPTNSPTLQPTIGPTLAPTYTKGRPTPVPSPSPTNPTFQPTPTPSLPPVPPTPAPTNPLICPAYTDLSNTQNALVNYAVCSIYVCPGATLTMGGCSTLGGQCVGDQYLRLYDETQFQVAENDDNCGKCASITYTFTQPTCQVYRLVQGCYGTTTCGGVTTIIGAGTFNLVAGTPSSLPTLKPQVSFPPTFPPKVPTPRPTIKPTFLTAAGPIACDMYQADETSMDTYRYGTCGLYMCAGTTVTMSMCSALYPGASCSGDTFLKLVDSQGGLVAQNGDGPAGCGSCSQITFTATAPCQKYILAEGCEGLDDCSGTVRFSGIEGTFQIATFTPTSAPSSLPPTVRPTFAPTYLPGAPTPQPTPGPTSPTFMPSPQPSAPTLSPTFSSTLAQFCPPFRVSKTNNALDGPYATCSLRVCEGATLTVGNCDVSGQLPGVGCAGDQYLRLYDAAGINVVSNDDACGTCSQLSFTPPTGSGCQTFTLREGCIGQTTCGGIMSVAGGAVIPALIPSQIPTLAPVVPDIPTRAPRPRTPAPTLRPLACTSFMAMNTNSNLQNFMTCGIYACAGVTFTASTCASSVAGAACTGDTMLSLYGQNNSLIIENDDGPGTCGLCSQFTITTTGPCQTYTLREGCHGQEACRGKAVVSGNNRNLAGVQIMQFTPTSKPTQDLRPTALPSPSPTLQPSFGPSTSPTYLPGHPTSLPTPQPSAPTESPTPQPSNPTPIPTLAPTYSLLCPPYDLMNTNNAFSNYAICGIYACPGSLIIAGNCHDGHIDPNQYGDSYLRLFDSIGYQVAENDDACGLGAQINFVVPQNMPCQTFALHQGCFGDTSCSGITSIAPISGISLVTFNPTQLPTTPPTPLYVAGSPTLAPAPQTPVPTVPYTSVLCDLFRRDLDNAMQYHPSCIVYACPGTTITVSACPGTVPNSGAFCQGQVYMKLYDSAHNLVSVNDGVSGPQCGGCPQITFSTSGQCQLYDILEGCQGLWCSGAVLISGPAGSFSMKSQYPTSAPVNQPTFPPNNIPTPLPTLTPSLEPTALPDVPTFEPTLAPSPQPTPSPTGPTLLPTTLVSYCPPYSSVNTSSAKVNPPLCTVNACPGEKIVIGSCSRVDQCVGDQYLRLVSPQGFEVDKDDDFCGLCSQITYQVSAKATSCEIFTIKMGCYGNSACAGEVGVEGSTLAYIPGTPTLTPTSVPSPEPSSAPTPEHTFEPTAHPTEQPSEHPSVGPTPHPSVVTVAPTAHPTAPTFEPSALPTTGFTQPSAMPTFVPSPSPSASPTPEPTTSPTASPTSDHPTPEPTAVPTSETTPTPTTQHPSPDPSPEPTATPTISPAPTFTPVPTSFALTCPTFDAVNTDSATNNNVVSCTIWACPGNDLLFSLCPKRGYGISLHGMSVLALYDQDGHEVGRNMDTNNPEFQCDINEHCMCSEIFYQTPFDSECQEYTLDQGCDANTDCGGTAAVIGFGGFEIWTSPDPTVQPTEHPTNKVPVPTARPTPRPTTRTPTRNPTKFPTTRPSLAPSVVPTPRPTAIVTHRPTREGETPDPTMKPTATARPTPGKTALPSKSSAPTMDFSGSDVYQTKPGTEANPNPFWGDSETGSGFGSVLVWNGLTLLAGASHDGDGDGMVEVFDCGPNPEAGPTSPLLNPFQCTFNTKVLYGDGSGSRLADAEFGWDVVTSDHFVAVAAPGVQQVAIYSISDLDSGDSEEHAITPDTLFVITAEPKGDPLTSDWGRAIALVAVPGEDHDDHGHLSESEHHGMILAVSDGVFTNAKGASTGRVYIYTSVSDASTWTLSQTLTSPTFNALPPVPLISQDRYFGDELKMSSMGVMVVGVGGSGVVYLYDCAFEPPFLCSPLKRSPKISPPSKLPLNELRAEYSIAINSGILVMGYPSSNGDIGSALVYSLVEVSASPTAYPTVSPSRLPYPPLPGAPTGAPTLPVDYFDNYQFKLTQTLVPDPSDTNKESTAWFASNIAINDNSLVAIGAPGAESGYGTVYMYHCPLGKCYGKEGNDYFQKMYCFSHNCTQDAEYASVMALSDTGAFLAKGNEGATFGNEMSTADLGNFELWWSDARIPLTWTPTPVPTAQPTLEPSAFATLAPTPTAEHTTSVPTPTEKGQFNCTFTVIQEFTGPDLNIHAIDADFESIVDVLTRTIAQVWNHPVDFEHFSDSISVAIQPENIEILSITGLGSNHRALGSTSTSTELDEGTTVQPALWSRDPEIRSLAAASVPMFTIQVKYRVTFDYIDLGYADLGYFALFEGLVNELRFDISQTTAVNNATATPPLLHSYYDESWFTQRVRYNAPVGSALKSAESAYAIPEPLFIAHTRLPTPEPTPLPTEEATRVTEAPTGTVETESASGSLKSSHNLPLIAGITVGVFVLALVALFYYRRWVMAGGGRSEKEGSHSEDYGDFQEQQSTYGDEEQTNPIYRQNNPGNRVEYDRNSDPAFRRASGWSGQDPNAGDAYQYSGEGQPSPYESPNYMDQANPGFKQVQRASLLPVNTRGSFSRLTPGGQLAPPQAPPLMAPPVAPTAPQIFNPLLPPGALPATNFGMPQNLPSLPRLGGIPGAPSPTGRLKPFAPPKHNALHEDL